MKRMLKLAGLSVALACVFTLAKAQTGQTPSDQTPSGQTPADQMQSAETHAAKMTEWMKSNLNLSADQVGKVQEVNMKYAVRMDSLKKSINDIPDRSAGIKSESDSKDAELKGVLTEQQYKMYLDKKKEVKDKYKDKDKSQSAQ